MIEWNSFRWPNNFFWSSGTNEWTTERTNKLQTVSGCALVVHLIDNCNESWAIRGKHAINRNFECYLIHSRRYQLISNFIPRCSCAVNIFMFLVCACKLQIIYCLSRNQFFREVESRSIIAVEARIYFVYHWTVVSTATAAARLIVFVTGNIILSYIRASAAVVLCIKQRFITSTLINHTRINILI